MSLWSQQTAQLHAFMRNDPPSRASLVALQNGTVTNSPLAMHAEFLRVWQPIESWKREQDREEALEALEDHWSLFPPHETCHLQLEPKHMLDCARAVRNSSPGLDAWTCREIRALPIGCWREISMHGKAQLQD